MKVAVNNKMYEMTDKQAKDLKESIKNSFEKGIFAIKKGDYMELRNDTFKSKKKLFEAVFKWNSKGFVAYWKW